MQTQLTPNSKISLLAPTQVAGSYSCIRSLRGRNSEAPITQVWIPRCNTYKTALNQHKVRPIDGFQHCSGNGIAVQQNYVNLQEHKAPCRIQLNTQSRLRHLLLPETSQRLDHESPHKHSWMQSARRTQSPLHRHMRDMGEFALRPSDD